MANVMSDLELELERDGALVYAGEPAEEITDGEDDHEDPNGELEDDEYFGGAIDDAETDDELEALLRGESDQELEDDELVDPDVRGFAERFHELSLRDGESELEIEQEVDAIVREMEREYFLKGLLKKVAPIGKALFKKGLAYAAKATPLGQVINAATALSKGNMRGLIGSLASAGLKIAGNHPAFAAVMPALSAIGFKPGSKSKAPWQKLAGIAKSAYGQLAKNLTPDADEPAKAAEIAHRSFKTALHRATGGAGMASRPGVHGRRARLLGSGGGGGRNIRVVTLAPGERLLIKVR